MAVGVTGWRDRSACQRADPDLFTSAGVNGQFTAAQAEEALGWCAFCLVRGDCLRDALAAGDVHHSIRGGLLPAALRPLHVLPPRVCGVCAQPLSDGENPNTRYHPGDCQQAAKRGRVRKYDKRRRLGLTGAPARTEIAS